MLRETHLSIYVEFSYRGDTFSLRRASCSLTLPQLGFRSNAPDIYSIDRKELFPVL